jgi:copper chaperone CopZ
MMYSTQGVRVRILRAALALSILATAASAQGAGGSSNDPIFHAEGVAPHAASERETTLKCHKDHSGLALAAAEPVAEASERIAAAVEAGGELITVSVADLECPYCAAAIQDAFEARGDLAAAAVDLKSGAVTLVTEPGESIDDKTIRKIIGRRGYDVGSINRGGAFEE